MLAITSISLALIFYTIGVWSEKAQGELKKLHLVLFWLGIIFDTLGTTLMSQTALDSPQLNFHGITGLLAIVLMLFHAVWATVVLIKKNEKAKINFHKFSIAVWLIWQIPYISGAIFGMTK